LSLDDIEHETIRKEFRDPRIHAAVNCASLGCPSLVRYAFVGKQIDKQLEESMKNFLENSSKNRVDKKTIKLNQIFKWYENDFKEKDGSLLNYIKRYIPSAKNVEEISYLDYDWKLNDY